MKNSSFCLLFLHVCWQGDLKFYGRVLTWLALFSVFDCTSTVITPLDSQTVDQFFIYLKSSKKQKVSCNCMFLCNGQNSNSKMCGILWTEQQCWEKAWLTTFHNRTSLHIKSSNEHYANLPKCHQNNLQIHIHDSHLNIPMKYSYIDLRS